MNTDSKLENEADVLGVNPLSLGSFCVKITKGSHINKLRQHRSSEIIRKNIFKPQKVDQESFKKHGIAFSIGCELTAMGELEIC